MKPYFAFLAGALLAACAATDVSSTPPRGTGDQPAPATIPAGFRGTWTINESGRHPPGGENPTVVGATTWQGHESHGRVTSVQLISDTEVNVVLAMTGEGEEWADRRNLRLAPDGNSMTVSNPDNQRSYLLYRVR